MQSNPKYIMVFLPIVLLTASVLLFANLSGSYLWQDEAETALISETILDNGIPLGYDGKNFFSQVGESAYGKDHIWVLDPWLPYYLLALFFKAFGISTFVARLPFVLFGVATIILTFFFARAVSRDSKAAAAATVLLTFSVSFLILSRQCRYYSLCAFFSMLGLYGYIMMTQKRRAGPAILIVSSVLLFYCNHLFCGVLLAAVFFHALLCCRGQLARVGFSCLAVLALSVPWLIWISGMRYVDFYGNPRFLNRAFFAFMYNYLSHINNFIFPFFLLLIPAGSWVLLRLKGRSIKDVIAKDIFLWKNILLLFLFVGFTLTALSIISPAPFFRYLAQLIPVFCIITALIIRSVAGPRFWRGFAIIMICAGIIFFADYQYSRAYPGREGISYPNPFDYAYEITHDYDGPVEGIVEYLKEYGSDKDVAAITYGDLPVKFYTGMRVIGQLTNEDLFPARDADWIIIRKSPDFSRSGHSLTRYIMENTAMSRYSRITIDYPDIEWENRPSPKEHYFRTAEDEDKVIIHRKR